MVTERKYANQSASLPSVRLVIIACFFRTESLAKPLQIFWEKLDP